MDKMEVRAVGFRGFYRGIGLGGMVFSLLLVSAVGKVDAAPSQGKKVVRTDVVAETASPKAVTGTISYVDGKYISIVYNTDSADGTEYEIGFWVDEATQAAPEWKKDLTKLNTGDTVDISYDEMIEEYDALLEDGTKERKARVKEFKPKGLTFRAPAKKK